MSIQNRISVQEVNKLRQKLCVRYENYLSSYRQLAPGVCLVTQMILANFCSIGNTNKVILAYINNQRKTDSIKLDYVNIWWSLIKFRFSFNKLCQNPNLQYFLLGIVVEIILKSGNCDNYAKTIL